MGTLLCKLWALKDFIDNTTSTFWIVYYFWSAGQCKILQVASSNINHVLMNITFTEMDKQYSWPLRYRVKNNIHEKNKKKQKQKTNRNPCCNL